MERRISSPTVSAASVRHGGSATDIEPLAPTPISDRSILGEPCQSSAHTSHLNHEGTQSSKSGFSQEPSEDNQLLSQGHHGDSEVELEVNAGSGDSSHYENIPTTDRFTEDNRVSPGSGPTKSKWDRMEAFWMYGWTIEVLGCLLSLVSFFVIIVTLVVHNGKPFPAWPLGITINALISVFGVLLKAGMTIPLSEGISQLKWQWFSQQPRRLVDMEEFDAASRGPWGSFLFLLRMEPGATEDGRSWLWPWHFFMSLFVWRQTHLLNSFAKVSALLTVLSFAIDPFTQQIVQSAPCSRESDNFTGRYSRTSTYIAQSGHIGAGTSLINNDIAVAIQLGLMNPPSDPGATSLVSFQCATGGCNSANFSTVAVCHACQDMTASVHKPTSVHDGTNYTIPAKNDTSEFPEVSLGHRELLTSVAQSGYDSNLVRTKILGLPGAAMQYTLENNPVAVDCQLKPCIRTMRSKVEGSVLVEEELSRHPIGANQLLFTSGSALETTFQLVNTGTYGKIINSDREKECIGVPDQAADHVQVATANVDASPLTFPESSDQDSIPASLWYPQSCVWSFGFAAAQSIGDDLENNLDKLVMYYMGGPPSGSIVARQVYNKGNLDFEHVDRFMRDLSNVMTATIRKTGGASNGTGSFYYNSAGEYAVAPAEEPTSCLVVRWPWLAYPAVLVVLAALWLVIMVWQSPRGEMTKRGWKSSSLAVLLTEVAGQRLLGGAVLGEKTNGGQAKELFDTSRSQIDAFATAVDAQLVRDEDGRARLV